MFGKHQFVEIQNRLLDLQQIIEDSNNHCGMIDSKLDKIEQQLAVHSAIDEKDSMFTGPEWDAWEARYPNLPEYPGPILICGTGYEGYMYSVWRKNSGGTVAGFLDINNEKCGQTINGVEVFSFNQINDISYDNILIVIYLWNDAYKMFSTLVSLGVPCDKIKCM